MLLRRVSYKGGGPLQKWNITGLQVQPRARPLECLMYSSTYSSVAAYGCNASWSNQWWSYNFSQKARLVSSSSLTSGAPHSSLRMFDRPPASWCLCERVSM